LVSGLEPGAAGSTPEAQGVSSSAIRAFVEAADQHVNTMNSFYESPTYITVSLRSSGDEVLYDAEYNVAFGPMKQPQLVERLK
jgi:hypothetical protein